MTNTLVPAAVLGGLDALVFTAGVGEHSAPVRAALCAKLAWIGVKLDNQANDANGFHFIGEE
jgi:acetate kinase